MPRYFAYGSNMASHRLTTRVGRVETLGIAVLRAYRHAFSKHGSDGTAKGNIEPHPAGTVWGVVYELSLAQFSELDIVEGGYLRARVIVDRRGQHVEAITYVAIAPIDGLEPTAEYIEFYESGVLEHDIPLEYWHSIRPKGPVSR